MWWKQEWRENFCNREQYKQIDTLFRIKDKETGLDLI